VQSEAVFFSSFESDYAGRVKARQQIESFPGERQRQAFTPAVILFIALPETQDNLEPG
jgi:hypothetical protein